MNPLTKTKILVTVGTTQFDGLIEYTDSPEFTSLVAQAGYSEEDVLYQIGTTGSFLPTHSHFRLHPDIQQIYDSHPVIITHGGAGTLLACLRHPHLIIAVANNTLAGNHQTELIRKLHQEQFILGFDSVEQFREGREEVLRLLRGERQLKRYKKAGGSVLNTIVFGDDR